MALPETTPNLATPAIESDQKNPLKVTWLQHMLDEQKKAIVQDSPRDKPQKASPAEQLAFVASKFDEVINQTAPTVEQAPAPKQEASITWGLEGKPLESSPLSGSILKLLMAEPGIKERIDSGTKNGHTYSIVHQPGQKNFWLWDKWTGVDKAGAPIPQKRADPFFIKNPEDIKPEVKEVAPIMEESAPGMVPLKSQEFMKIPMIPEEEGQVPAKKLDKLPEIKKEASPVNAPNSHWALMRSKFSNNTFNEKSPQEQSAFQEKADSQIQPHFVDKIREYEAEQEALKPTFLELALGGKVEGELLNQWNDIKDVYAHAFLYPDQYTWGAEKQDRTLAQYPEAFKNLRAKVLGAVEKLGQRGVDIKTVPIHEAIDQAIDLNLL